MRVYTRATSLLTTIREEIVLMRRLSISCAALLALATSVAASSSASAEKLTLSHGGTALEPGNFLFLPGGVEVGGKGLDCEPGNPELFVSVLTNSKATDQLKIEGIERSGLPGEPPCRTFTGNAAVNTISLGAVLKLRATGSATVGPVFVDVTFAQEEYKGGIYTGFDCIYKRGTLYGANTATTTAQQLQVGFGGTLGLDLSASVEKAKHLCPGDVELSLSLPLTEDELGQAIEEQIVA